jgi:glycogen operon protein
VRVKDDSFLLVLSAHREPITFRLPPEAARASDTWEVVVDTAEPTPSSYPEGASNRVVAAGESFAVEGRSVVLLRGARRAGR